jgi:hypothetical protein
MDAKNSLCLVMLCSITIVKQEEASVNEVPTVVEITGELVAK